MLLEDTARCFGNEGNTDVVMPGEYVERASVLKRRFQERQDVEGVR